MGEEGAIGSDDVVPGPKKLMDVGFEETYGVVKPLPFDVLLEERKN